VRQNILLIQADATEAKTIQTALIGSPDGPFHVDWVQSHAAGLTSDRRFLIAAGCHKIREDFAQTGKVVRIIEE
jgi:hypothetical protein